MATIEYKNRETQEFFSELERKMQTETQQLRRGLYLLKNGLWFPKWPLEKEGN